MATITAPASDLAHPTRLVLSPLVWRSALVLGTVAVLAALALTTSPLPAIDADLTRVLRGMALIKGAFAVVALGACFWRMARPLPAWRMATYMAGAWMMTGAALAVWQMRFLGVAAACLHVALISLIILAFTDKRFFASSRRLLRRR